MLGYSLLIKKQMPIRAVFEVSGRRLRLRLVAAI